MLRKILAGCTGFDWDDNNSDKNWAAHRVSDGECEQIFFNRPLLAGDDRKHSNFEKRYFALGRTDLDRLLFIAFTIRSDQIRVISARDMNDKERRKYHEKIKKKDSRI